MIPMKLKKYQSNVSYKKFKGFSSYFATGKGKGWGIKKDGPSLRIDMGWISISWMSIDIQNLIEGLLEDLRKKDAKESQVNDLSEKLSKRSEEMVVEEKELTKRQNEFSALSNKHSEEVTKYKEKIDNWEAEYSDLDCDYESLREENEKLEKKITLLTEKLENNKEVYDKLIEESHEQSEEISDLLSDNAGLEAEIGLLQSLMSISLCSSSSSSSSGYSSSSSSSSF